MKEQVIGIDEHLIKRAECYVHESDIDTKNLSVVREYYQFQVKAQKEEDARDGIRISGYLSTFKNVDRQNDIVAEGAFNVTLKDIKRRGGKLPMLRDHMNATNHQIGSWDKFKIDEKGLYVEGFISRTKETEHLVRLIEDGHLDTLSMGGLFRYQENQNRKGNNIIEEVFLLEGSVVAIPANPKAQFSQKSLFVSENPDLVGNPNGEEVSHGQRVKNLISKYKTRS